jgi:predicted RNA binding protein YcfA (HicA-like mRNA interferase family)
MSRQPVMSGHEVVKAFEHLGWRVVRRHGSHVIMVRDSQADGSANVTLTIPDHPVVATGLLHALIRAAGVNIVDFEAASWGHHGDARERTREGAHGSRKTACMGTDGRGNNRT